MFSLQKMRPVLWLVVLWLVIFYAGSECRGQSGEAAIIINIPSRTLELYEGENLAREYRIAVGKESTPTPLGDFSITDKEVNPVWIPTNGDPAVPSGPHNPLGYRWLGLYGTYGIHGTNAPWSIGGSISNGCIRMYESDAEELFDRVKLGTPVAITYERLKIRLDGGGAFIGIYPDVYHRNPLSAAEVCAKLGDLGISGLVDENLVVRALQNNEEWKLQLGKIYGMHVNGKTLREKAIELDGAVYIPVWPVASAVKTDIRWDGQAGLIQAGQQTVKGLVRGNVLYALPEDIRLLFGGRQWLAQGEWYYNTFSLVVNGVMITNELEVVDGVLAVPLTSLLEGLGLQAGYQREGDRFLYRGNALPVTPLYGRPYIPIDKISQVLPVYVYWDQPTGTVEVTAYQPGTATALAQ
ncbi:L,D-transpeptidase [Propionispora vibrioides]|uniref:L,D-transpeptidase catalytic domain n=1 Tax=Propionispora vibrioides TaxID=112903 RepID=A0A1H8QWY5_9FIRM|nr:L,D-transpeptidase [Propionispora vibrioides]SEO58384.1 L,D-transpeptidase catalytic domain [Propionispora vibrioides]